MASVENCDSSGSITIARRRIKLPQASLTTFDGRYENWLSFKNAFTNMIGSQLDLFDVDKLYYLKLNKIKIFAVEGISYDSA